MNGRVPGRRSRKAVAPASAGCVLAAAFLAAASPVEAAPCAGFTDVDDSDSFCPSVQWLRNRNVTVGCSSTTLFCPSTAVDRLSMAAFMNRLGVAMSPQILYADGGSTSLALDTAPPAVCSTPTGGSGFAVSGFPRTAGVRAVLSAKGDGTAANVDLRLMMRVNGGAWTPVTAQPSSTGGVSEWFNAAIHRLDIPLAPGNSYEFGLGLTRSAAPAGTGNLQSWKCQVQVVIHSRTGASAPF